MLITVALLAAMSIGPAEARVEIRPDGMKPIAAKLQLDAEDSAHRGAFVELEDGAGQVLAQVFIDSHAGDWHEIVIQNGSIESFAGYWTGSYEVELETDQGSWSIQRGGAKFFDGTAYLELLGKPKIAPDPSAWWYYRAVLDLLTSPHGDAYVEAVIAAKPPPGLESYPHTAWSAEQWHTRKTIPYSTHQTGSPECRGIVDATGARAGILSFSHPDLSALYVGEVWHHLGQTSRRPIHFADCAGEVWKAPDWPGLVMGEHGPTTIWNATEFWGRPKEQPQGKFNGWDAGHLEMHTQAAAWCLFQSRLALRQMRHKADAVLTHPHTYQERWTSPRIWGWTLQALVIASALDPDPERAARYRERADWMLDSFYWYWNESPMRTFQAMHTYSNGSHLWGTPDQLHQAVTAFGYPWPGDDPDQVVHGTTAWFWFQTHVAAEADPGDVGKQKNESNAIGGYLASKGGAYFADVMGLWAFEPVFHHGVAAAAVRSYFDLTLDNDRVQPIAQHLLAYSLIEARSGAKTFWADTAAKIPGLVGGTGKDTAGTVEWSAGGTAALGIWATGEVRKAWTQAVDSVYRAPQEDKPHPVPHPANGGGFESWFLYYAAVEGLP